MSGFKEIINSDLKTFFNQDEFGELKELNGQQMNVIEADDELTERKLKSPDGTFIGDKLILVKASEFGLTPVIGRPITYEAKKYRITDRNITEGIIELTLEAYKS